jgi:hypothetical protein
MYVLYRPGFHYDVALQEPKQADDFAWTPPLDTEVP